MADEQEIKRAIEEALAAGLAAAQRSAHLTHTLHQGELADDLYLGEMAAVGAKLAQLGEKLTARVGVDAVTESRPLREGELDLVAVANNVMRARRASRG